MGRSQYLHLIKVISAEKTLGENVNVARSVYRLIDLFAFLLRRVRDVGG